MAVGAYASVLALMRALDNALLPSRSPLLPDKSQIEALQEKVGLLQESLEELQLPSQTAGDGSAIWQIREVVSQADDLLDRYVVEQLRGGESKDECGKSLSSSFNQEIQALTQRIVSANQELTMTMITTDEDRRGRVLQPHGNPSHAAAVTPSRLDSSRGNNTAAAMVGLEDVFSLIMEDLTGAYHEVKNIPIVGMGGTGKTTLARHIFDHEYISNYFDLRIWLTISQEYDVRDILLGLKRDGVVHGDDDDVYSLGEGLYRTLYGRRYLIVMDDVWSTVAWADLNKFFPHNGVGSRILITTRISAVADYISPTKSYTVNFLDESASWKLFQHRLLGDGGICPPELEEIGKKIVGRCKGLPLAIVVVAASISKFDLDPELWEAFAEKMDSYLDLDSDDNLTGILSLSYNSLPIHLKLCFVSMAEFFQGSHIEVSRLAELWVSVGIVKPNRDGRHIEEVAVEYIEDLVGRNMVMAVGRGYDGKIKTWAIHDLLKDMGIREAQGEGFLGAPKVQEISYPSLKSENSCFLCGKNGTDGSRIQLYQVSVDSPSTTPMNPKVCAACHTNYPRLDGSTSVSLIEKAHDQPVEIPQMTKLTSLSMGDRLRFSSKPIVFSSPSSISLLWNLRRLCFLVSGHDGTMLLSKIWEMPQLTYVHLLRHVLPDPLDYDKNAAVVLRNLRTLTSVKNLRLTAEVARRIPNIVRLSLLYDPGNTKEVGEALNCSYYCLDNLELLDHLQALKLACRRRSFLKRDVSMAISLKSVSFPRSLMKLTLKDTMLAWEDMPLVGSLPNLEVLKLNRDAFVGDEWHTGEGEFLRLKYLELEDLDLVSWAAEDGTFSDLTELVLFGLYQLEEIPLLFGQLRMMETVQAKFCTQRVVDLVNEIREEQQLYLNEKFRCVVDED